MKDAKASSRKEKKAKRAESLKEAINSGKLVITRKQLIKVEKQQKG
jgi:hypothetical protein